MPVLAANNPTLQDWASRVQDDKIAAIIEILNEQNEILADMTVLEGNLPTGHVTTVRSGLPSSTWRMLYQGVQPTKSKTVKVTDTTGMLEAYAEVDKAIADLNGNTSEFRLSEDRAFIEAMNQELASAIFYGNTESDPEKFMGLTPRYNSLSAENATNIVSGGGTGSDNTSIWLITWGPSTCHAIFPKGQKAGLSIEDKGQVTLFDSNTPPRPFEGYRTHYQWNFGLTLRNWKYVVRIANIDVSALTADASGASANLIRLMITAMHKIPTSGMGRMAFYCNRTIFTYLDLQTLEKSNTVVGYGNDIHGQPVLKFRNIPIRQCDQILESEETVGA